ncbi:hypothetical protein BC939DRAFT_455772 [Gamsiella multidivaricata]|uniref:uncharacterized protein n=1 Tax=Gamsiella multidivaricata TaxID=101098 RepID=UPI0022210EC6|nr:uncharacterized protein BC939DRAFT_455772 [Gamsiella multidivaricata]KAI7821349.1 hypothetical protein BC939DRAFT_455772 [Gamsiella multidivaricata]
MSKWSLLNWLCSMVLFNGPVQWSCSLSLSIRMPTIPCSPVRLLEKKEEGERRRRREKKKNSFVTHTHTLTVNRYTRKKRATERYR